MIKQSMGREEGIFKDINRETKQLNQVQGRKRELLKA